MDPDPALAAAVPHGGSAYVVTVGSDGRPHTAPTSAVVRDGPVVRVDAPGRRTRANAEAGSAVTVLWSPTDPGDHTLIVDGTGVVDDDALLVRPIRAVLHRRPRSRRPWPRRRPRAVPTASRWLSGRSMV